MNKFCESKFYAPDGDNVFFYTWCWNVPVSKKESERQIDEFAKAGIKGLYILPIPKEFRPDEPTYLEPDYLSEEFMALIRHALLYAQSRGITTWIYDEGGWPSGGACGLTLKHNKNALCKVINEDKQILKKGDIYISNSGTLATFVDGNRINSGYISECDVEITIYSIYAFAPSNSHVDILDPSVAETFLKLTYDRYKEYVGDMFGTKINGMFTDEPHLLPDAWTNDFEKIFFDEYGYDILDYLPCIMHAELATTESKQQARVDYMKLIGSLMRKNFFDKIHQWCIDNKLQLCGHLVADDAPGEGGIGDYYSILDILRSFDIPGIDTILHQIKMPKENEKPVPESAPYFPRIASSAARQSGKRFALSESFAIYGDALLPDEMRYVINYQAVRGINVFNYMSMSYGKEGYQSFGGRPTPTSGKPGFYNFAHVNDYVGRLTYVMSLGKPIGNTALYCPSNDIYAGGEVGERARSAYRNTGVLLEDMHIDFDIIDDEGIRLAECYEDGLRLGDAVYTNIVVPCDKYMPKDLKEKIRPYHKETKEAFTSDNNSIRLRCRDLGEEGMIVFAFNESSICQTATVLGGYNTKYIYKLDLTNGYIYKLQSTTVEILSGDAVVFLLSDNEYTTVDDTVSVSVPLGDPVVESCTRFCIFSEGFKNIACAIEEIDSPDFSGEVTYSMEYLLQSEPQSGEKYRISFEDTKCTARVFVDGQFIGTCGLTPMNIDVDGCMLSNSGKITVILSNTPANEIIAKSDVFEAMGCVDRYHNYAIEYEKNAPGICIGKAMLSKLNG